MQLECKQTTESKLTMSQPMNTYYQEGMDIDVNVNDIGLSEENQLPTVIKSVLDETNNIVDFEHNLIDLTQEDEETQEVGYTIDRRPSIVNEDDTAMVGLYDEQENVDDNSTARLYESDDESDYDSITESEEHDAQLVEDIDIAEHLLDMYEDHEEEEDEYIGLASIARTIGIQARHYYRQKETNKALENLIQAISINPFAEYYTEIASIYDNQNNYEKAKYYYMKAIENNDDVNAMYNVADIFRKESNSANEETSKYSTKMSLKYYAMAANKGDNEALEILCPLAYGTDPVKFSIAFKKIMEHQDDHYIWDDYDDDDEEGRAIYLNFLKNTGNIAILKMLQSTDTEHMNETEKKHINDCIDLLNKETSVTTYNNKVSLFKSLNHVVECGICYDEKLNINLHCGHCVCTDCYTRLYKKCCPFCRVDTPYGFFD